MFATFVLLVTLQSQAFPIERLTGLKAHKTRVEAAKHQGMDAVRVLEATPAMSGEDRLVVVEGAAFQDGEIEVELAGTPGAGAATGARGFVGVAFRVAADLKAYDAFYLRPTNGRAEDQVRRNHSVQYISFPDWPWERLRKEYPEKYESYADLQPDVWTKVRIVVQGATARLYVHGSNQPVLIVNDLKGPKSGGVALWIGPGTRAHFRALVLKP